MEKIRKCYNQYDCFYCLKSIKGKTELTHHIENHLLEKPFICKNCSRRYRQEASLSDHNLKAHLGKVQRYTCTSCFKGFFNRYNYTTHLKSHGFYRCRYCSTSLLCNSSLSRHVKRLHESISFGCNYCLTRLSSPRLLGKHIRRIHEVIQNDKLAQVINYFENNTVEPIENFDYKPKRHHCSYCDKQYLKRKYLTEHLVIHRVYERQMDHKYMTKKYRPFYCSDCSEKFIMEDCLIDHIREEHKNVQFNCFYCGTRFLHKFFLLFHLKEYCYKTFLKGWLDNSNCVKQLFDCYYCSEDFTDKTQLKTHIEKHMKESPYFCYFCSRRYNNDTKLADHVQIHLEEEFFFCFYCSEGFDFEWKWEKHLKEHPESTKNCCCYCIQPFSKRGFLLKHLLGCNWKPQFYLDLSKPTQMVLYRH